MQRSESSTTTAKRPPRAPSRPDRGSPPVIDGEATGLGDVYLDTFGPPALASTTDVYMQVYATVRAILEGMGATHATTAVKAAWDAAAAHIERRFAGGGHDE